LTDALDTDPTTLETPMTEQYDKPGPVCRMCATRPASVTRWIGDRQLATCESCSPAELSYTIGELLMGGPAPLPLLEAHQLALAGVITALVGPPPPATRASDPFSVDGRFPASMAVALHDAGASAGATWVQQAATRKERRCLAALCEGLDEEWLYPFSRDQVPGVRSGAEAFHALLRPGEDEPEAAEAFWHGALEEADRGKQASGQFVRGFLEGAAYWARLNKGAARRQSMKTGNRGSRPAGSSPKASC
jgi:hypothetical protein